MRAAIADGKEATRDLSLSDDWEEKTGRTEVTVNLQHPSQPEIQVKESEAPSKRGHWVINILTIPAKLDTWPKVAGFFVAAALVAFLATRLARLF